jgi:hypothetical protein
MEAFERVYYGRGYEVGRDVSPTTKMSRPSVTPLRAIKWVDIVDMKVHGY